MSLTPELTDDQAHIIAITELQRIRRQLTALADETAAKGGLGYSGRWISEIAHKILDGTC